MSVAPTQPITLGQRPTGVAAPLPSPHPLGATLPALYQEDPFAQGLCAALDQILAPLIAILDCLPAYLDPGTAPPDLLDLLGGWLGLSAGPDLPLERRRALLAASAELHARRGTPWAVRQTVKLLTGLDAELDESGGTGWSPDAGTPLPGRRRPGLVVRVRPGSTAVDEVALRRMLALMVPAHLPWRLDVVH